MGASRLSAWLAPSIAALALAASGCTDAASPDDQGRVVAESGPAYPGLDYAELSSAHLTPADAALAFLDTLSAEQRTEALFDFRDERRRNWSNLPPGIFDSRNGVRLGDLTPTQAEALHRFLASALSAHGYATATAVVGAEDQLAASSVAGRFRWSSGDYWLAFFGEPSNAPKRWGWQFGGHHLAVNATVVGERSTLSPTFVGVEPARYETADGIVAPLDDHRAAGLALVNALDEFERRDALAETRPRETLTGAGKDGVVPAIEGVAVGSWNAEQQRQLLDLVGLWLNMLPTASAEARLAEVSADLPGTCFTWHGDTHGASAIYYRVQGPRLIIEFSTQGRISADGGHYHSIYRDPTNDYGWIAEKRDHPGEE